MESEDSFPHSQASPPVPILSQLDQVRTPTSHFLNIHIIIILPSKPVSTEWSLSLRFSLNILNVFSYLWVEGQV
jgi:hypothetical protein